MFFSGALFTDSLDWATRRREIDAEIKRLYEEEVRKLWSKVYTANEDQIATWLEDPLINFVPCKESPQSQERALKQLRDKARRSIALNGFAVFIIASPLNNQYTTEYINGHEYQWPLRDEQKLTLEIEDLKEKTDLGKIEKDGLLDSVFATTFEKVKLHLKNFMRDKATKAKEIRIIFMGHGGIHEGQGTMCFQEESQPVTNAQLFNAVKEYRDENGDRLLGSAISIVLAQCYSHLGIDRICQEENLSMNALASKDFPCPEVYTKQECWHVGESDKNTFRLPLEKDVVHRSFHLWHKTDRLEFPVTTAKRHCLVEWLKGDIRFEESMDTDEGFSPPVAASFQVQV